MLQDKVERNWQFKCYVLESARLHPRWFHHGITIVIIVRHHCHHRPSPSSSPLSLSSINIVFMVHHHCHHRLSLLSSSSITIITIVHHHCHYRLLTLSSSSITIVIIVYHYYHRRPSPLSLSSITIVINVHYHCRHAPSPLLSSISLSSCPSSSPSFVAVLFAEDSTTYLIRNYGINDKKGQSSTKPVSRNDCGHKQAHPLSS